MQMILSCHDSGSVSFFARSGLSVPIGVHSLSASGSPWGNFQTIPCQSEPQTGAAFSLVISG